MSHTKVLYELNEMEQYAQSINFILVEAQVLLSFRAQIHHAHDTPGTAFPFALTLVELLCGADKRAEVRAPMVFPPNTPF
jgi:hypothetical protein